MDTKNNSNTFSISDQGIREAMRRLQPDPPKDMTERFMVRLQNHRKSKRKGWRVVLWGVGSVAAAALVAIAVLPSVNIEEPRQQHIASQTTHHEQSVQQSPQHKIEIISPSYDLQTKQATTPRPAQSATPKVIAKAKEIPADTTSKKTAVPKYQETPANHTQTLSIATDPKLERQFTPREQYLMDRAEQMSYIAATYTAEVLQEQRIRHQELIQASTKEENIKTQNNQTARQI